MKQRKERQSIVQTHRRMHVIAVQDVLTGREAASVCTFPSCDNTFYTDIYSPHIIAAGNIRVEYMQHHDLCIAKVSIQAYIYPQAHSSPTMCVYIYVYIQLMRDCSFDSPSTFFAYLVLYMRRSRERVIYLYILYTHCNALDVFPRSAVFAALLFDFRMPRVYSPHLRSLGSGKWCQVTAENYIR